MPKWWKSSRRPLKVRKWEIQSRDPGQSWSGNWNNWKSIWNFGRWRNWRGGWTAPSQSNLRKQSRSSRWGNPWFQHPWTRPRRIQAIPLSYKGTLPSYLDKIVLSTSDDQILVKALLRQTRRPEVGDKFSSATAKGCLWPDPETEDLPFTDGGYRPWHCNESARFPSRMTVGNDWTACRKSRGPYWHPTIRYRIWRLSRRGCLGNADPSRVFLFRKGLHDMWYYRTTPVGIHFCRSRLLPKVEAHGPG